MRRALVFALLAASFLPHRAARAEGGLGSLMEVLDENVVTGASRSAERAADAPATSTTITSQQLRRLGITHLGDALNYLSLGMFSHDRMSTAGVGARGVAVSGDSNGHVLLVLDGLVVNEQGGGAAFLHDIPLELVDHIEVILGPGSVLYGAQAMLGVINVVTKPVSDYEGFHATTSFGYSPPLDPDGGVEMPKTYSSLGHDNRYTLGMGRSFRLFGKPVSILASLDFSDFKGPHFTFGKQALPNVDLGPHAQPGYWGGPVDEQWYSRTTGTFVRVNVGELTWTTRATVTELAMPQMDLFESRSPAVYDDARNRNNYTLFLSGLQYDKRFSDRLTGFARGYFGYSGRRNDRYLEGHDALVPGVPLGVIDPDQCPAGPVGPCTKEALFYSRWIGLELQSTLDWLGDGAYTTMVGVDGRLRTAAYEFVAFDELTGKSYGSDSALTRWHSGGNAQANEQALGAYVQQRLRPSKFVAFNAGIRADIDTRIRGAYTTDALSPRAAVIATPTDDLSLKLIYSKAFRAPSFLEQNIVNGRLLPNPGGLKPETVSSYEAAATLRLGSYALTASTFYANWHNLIELRILNAAAPSVSRFENVSDIRNYGAGLSFDGKLAEGALDFGVNAMIAAAQRDLSLEQQARNAPFGAGDSLPLAVAPRVFGNLHASYNYYRDMAAALAVGFMGRRIADQAYYGGDVSNLSPRPDAPPQLKLRGALTGSVPWVSGVGYTLGGEYAFASHDPFVVGPNQGNPRYLVNRPTSSELAFVNRLTIFAGLEMSLGGADTSKHAAQPPSNSQ
jgi:outer membrane receptor protein involved in Fe transport